MAKGFCTCHRYTDEPKYLPPEGAKWHYLCDKPVAPPVPDDDGEAQRIAEVFADARAEQDRGL